MRSDEIREKIFELESELEETEMDEIIREGVRKDAEVLKIVRDEFLKAGLPEKFVDELLLIFITVNVGE